MNRDKAKHSNQLNFWSKIKRDIAHLVFPESCLICATELHYSEQHLCTLCASNLQRTYFELEHEENAIERMLSGRIAVEYAYAYVYFEKNKSTQHVLHQLKYGYKEELGAYLGEQMGKELMARTALDLPEVLIPTPLHPRKAFLRGYNQSLALAKGISNRLGVPVNNHILSKTKLTGSQTKLNRTQRWMNVVDGFKLSGTLNGIKHVALVDDVITTGSTLESIATLLRENYPDLRISIYCFAYAK